MKLELLISRAFKENGFTVDSLKEFLSQDFKKDSKELEKLYLLRSDLATVGVKLKEIETVVNKFPVTYEGHNGKTGKGILGTCRTITKKGVYHGGD